MLLNKLKKLLYFLFVLTLLGCSSASKIEENSANYNLIRILSLGDSYTIGESVCTSCRFPEQLKDALQQKNKNLKVDLKVIAKTGWTTTNLINAIKNENVVSNFDLVTLLIGVNNQYQGLPFSIFEKEFPILIEKAILAAQSSKKRLIVVSIPDYAFTPFGKGSETISNALKKHNTYIKTYCKNKSITFVNITDITKMGLSNPNLVASDGLHPSTKAYAKFVQRLLPVAFQKIEL